MKKNLTLFLTSILCLIAMGAKSQYSASSSIYTPYYDESRPFSTRQIKNTACDIKSIANREALYAIVGMNSHHSTYCERYMTLGSKSGSSHTILAHSDEAFSWDHSGITKVLFDPRNQDPDVFYVLYQETNLRHTHPSYDATDRRTYLKSFSYNGTPVLSESNRVEIFNFNNGADFVVNSDGKILVCGVDDNGTIKGQRVINMAPSGSVLTLSDYGEAKIGTQLQRISMDIKGNKAVLGHTTGSISNTQMRVVRYDLFGFPGIFGGLFVSTISERFVNGHRMREDVTTPKTVAIRGNGDVFYLNWNFSPFVPSTYDLIKLDVGSSAYSSVFTQAPSAEDLVISEDDNIYVGGIVAGEHAIGLFNQYDVFEYLYDVHSDLDNPMHDIAISDCDLLASGHRFTGAHHRPSHQTFSCDDCESGVPHSDYSFTGSTGGSYTPTPFGTKYISKYCDKYEVVIDGSASTCENSYWIQVRQINPVTWSLIGPPILASWIDFNNEVPNHVQLWNYLPSTFNFNPSATYLLTLTVGNSGAAGPLHSEHKLFGTDINLCPEGGGTDISWLKSLNTDKTAEDLAISVYPNPTNGEFTIGMEDQDLTNHSKITNLQGQLIFENEFKGSTQINLRGNPAGVYLLTIQNNEGIFTRRIVLK